MEIPRDSDVFVVVVVADSARSPVDKACGEGLMPNGVAALERLGVTLADDDVFPFHGIRFIDGDFHAEAAFPGISALGIRRTIIGERAALLGDASGSVDAITGHGLSTAFQQAVALAEALAPNDLRSYRAAHRRIGRLLRMMARLLLLMSDAPWVRRRALTALRSRPEVFHWLLGVHVGAFAWQLVAADASVF
jgi:2-polyprenyl-6-methoxyphenol hydroxylase-like FAD-dependent oxidoreductase